jgi:CBS domain-containing protein
VGAAGWHGLSQGGSAANPENLPPMKVTGNVSAILNSKGTAVWSVAPDATVLSAICLMGERNIGAVLVMEQNKLVGIVSERDYTRKVILKGRSSKETRVGDIMASPAITVTPQHSVDECLHIMTEHRIRHLPVVEHEKVAGVVSIGDLVNWVISAQSAAIDHLEDYISGRYPG